MDPNISETQGLIDPNAIHISKEKNYEDSGPDRIPLIRSSGYPIVGVCLYLFIISPLIMGIALYVSARAVNNSTTQSTGVMEYIETNAKTPLIADIQVASGTSGCGSGYTQMTLTQWPGTKGGCYHYGIFFSASVTSGGCGRHSSGTTVWSESAKDLTNFDGSVFCAKYLQPSTDYVYTSSCSSGYTSCGPYLCVKSSLSCPIITVTYSSTVPSDLPQGSTSVQLNGGAGYLILQSGSSSTPLLNLQVEFNGAPCLSATQHPVKSSGSYYPLLETQPEGCGTYGTDNNAVLLTSDSEENMLLDNGIEVDTDLKLYSSYLNGSKAQLYARSRIDVKQNSYCYQLNASMLQDATGGVNGTISSVQICALILIIGGAIIVFALGFLTYSKVQSFSIDAWGRSIRWPVALVGVGVLILNIVMTAIASVNVSDVQAQAPALQELSDANCFTDSELDQGATDFLAVPGKTIGIYWGVVVSLISSILITIPIFVVSFIYYRRQGLKLD